MVNVARADNNGGKRAGAGRKKGVPNKKTAAVVAKAEASGAMPLDVMLKVMRMHDKSGDVFLKNKQFKEAAVAYDLAAERAAQAAPYLHPRLQSVTHKGVLFDPTKLTDEQLDLAIRLRESIERDKSGSTEDGTAPKA